MSAKEVEDVDVKKKGRQNLFIYFYFKRTLFNFVTESKIIQGQVVLSLNKRRRSIKFCTRRKSLI